MDCLLLVDWLLLKKKKLLNYIYVINSDGEMAEGSNWEAILFASHHKLDNLILIINNNKLQSFDSVENTLGIEPMKDKFLSFGWNVYEIDGHNFKSIEQVLSICKFQRKSKMHNC